MMLRFPVAGSLSNLTMNSIKCKSSFKENISNNTTTSTPLVKEGRTRNSSKENIKKKTKDEDLKTLNHLLEIREEWPLAYSEACQEYINNLHLNLDKDILCADVQGHNARSRIKTPNILRRSLSRDRSMSPGGSKHIKESKWDKIAETVVILINEIMFGLDDLSDQDLYLESNEKEAKELSQKIKNVSNNELPDVLKTIPKKTLMLCLKGLLKKLGLAVPKIISHQFVLLKGLLEHDGGSVVINHAGVKAVQTMMYTISRQGRNMLHRTLILFNRIVKMHSPSLSKSTLAHWLLPSLFEEDKEMYTENLKMCRDFITLGVELFQTPVGLVELVEKKVNSKISKGVMIQVPIIVQGVVHNSSPTTTTTSSSFKSFVNAKYDNKSSVILKGYKVISSPDRNITKAPFESTKKRLSLVDKTKKFCKRALSPMRPMKGSYDISTFYPHEKRSKAQEKV